MDQMNVKGKHRHYQSGQQTKGMQIWLPELYLLGVRITPEGGDMLPLTTIEEKAIKETSESTKKGY